MDVVYLKVESTEGNEDLFIQTETSCDIQNFKAGDAGYVLQAH